MKSFAEHHFFEGMSAPFTVTEKDLFGKHILFLLSDKRFNESREADPRDYENSLSIELSDTIAKRSPDLVKLSRINRWLDEQMKGCLYVWVMAQVELGESRYHSARRFFARHGIHDEQIFTTHYTYLKRRTNKTYYQYRYGRKEKEEIKPEGI